MRQTSMQRTSSVKWTGSLREGKGKITTGSGAIREMPYSFATRFGGELGTNPEELIASAHAGCFAMAVAMELEKCGYEPKSLEAEAKTSLVQENSHWMIKAIHLTLTGVVPEISEAEFKSVAHEAKENCPVSRVLNADISLEAKLSSKGADQSAPKKNRLYQKPSTSQSTSSAR